MAQTLVIGYGNPLRGDDQIGWLVAARLRQALGDDRSGDVEIISCHQLMPELSDALSRAEQVIFVDACVGPYPGAFRHQTIAAAASDASFFTHDLDPSTLLALTQALFSRVPPIASLITVDTQSFGYDETLSAPVAATLPLIVEHVLGMLDSWSNRRQVWSNT